MADPLLPGPLWLAGCGNMAGAMLARWIEEGIDPAHVSVIRPSGRPIGEGVRVTTDYPEDEVPAIVLLGMKPYQLDVVADALAPILDEETILVSILAGVELASLRMRFPVPRTIIRAMPNLPVRLGKGVIGLFSDSDDLAARNLTTGLMAPLGHAEWFDDETLFNLVTTLAGSGPALVYRFIDALAEGGAKLGFPKDRALHLALATVEGAAILARSANTDPSELARQVTSPGGTTEAGLKVLDSDGALSDLVVRTLEASRRRSLEIAAEARRKE
ncbi:pyrroline-5-carboxylate reductase [Sphingosinicella sp. LHD-64]|uniref:pyrroline-5-carboxylate reductase family protein n=1 Tax=Sphingosinicella sp. LHD-64 TaxID=3072139 RepID=UPI00280E6DE3|nr:pyrroline-5-carboxylate reductase [Sphingosinicella sp. LHD-64]MDQ8755496.1 pyrroline-5-carboxylate reductase [Sphingosinicella sp. LHD-64]